MSRSKQIREIILNYKHDYEMEGDAITKRRLWYILKPQLVKLYPDTKKKNANQDYNRYYNEMAESNLIDDSYIEDGSRYMKVGSTYPHVILAIEKATITDTMENIADVCGFSLYVSGGHSSIYAAKKLMRKIQDVTDQQIDVIVLTDYDKSGIEIAEAMKVHFKTNRVFRLLLTKEQIPADKKSESFGYSPELGYWYELDILNVHRLREYIASELETFADQVEEKLHNEILHDLKLKEVLRTPKVIALSDELEALKQKEYQDSKLQIELVDYSLNNVLKIPQELQYRTINEQKSN